MIFYYLFLFACAIVSERLARRFEKRWALSLMAQTVVAGAFVLGLSRLGGGGLNGDFFSSGLWGRGSFALAALWIVGLTQAYPWMHRAGLPAAGQTFIATLGIAALAGLRGNYPAAFVSIAFAGLMAASIARTRRRHETRAEASWWALAGFALGGAAIIAESGSGPHVAFSAWLVVLFVPLADGVASGIRSLWRKISAIEEPEGLLYHQRLIRFGWTSPAADRLYWGLGLGLALLAVGHYAFGWPGVHWVLAALAGVVVGLEWGTSRVERPAGHRRKRNWAGAEWAIIALLLFAFLTRAINLLHQGFLTWDESRYAFIAREFLVTHDLGWTGARPLYILLMGWAYALLGINDSIAGYVSLIFGIISIALTYAWAKRAFGRGVAIASAVILTASILHNWYSRYQNSLTVVMTFLALAGWAYSHSLAKGRPWGALLLSGGSLGFAWMSHYAMGLAVPFWLLFEAACPISQAWRLRLQRLMVFGLGLSAALLVWQMLMPPGDGPIPNLLYHSKIPIGCCLADDVKKHLLPGGSSESLNRVPEVANRFAGGNWGDVWYYWRAILAFEGYAGLLALILSLVWALVRIARRRDLQALHLLTTTFGPLAILSATAAIGLDARARTLAIVIPGLAILIGIAVQDGIELLGAARAARSAGFAASLCAVLLLGAVRAAPLWAMTTPYDSVRRWLIQRGARTLVVFNPYGDDNGFAWKFYFGDVAQFAATEEETRRACAELGPDYLITAGEKVEALADRPIVARFDNPIYSNIPRLYDQVPHSRDLGQGLALSLQPSQLIIYDMRGCGPQ
ncbi:MAG: glycosyltransferase family 39 protein [Chloroflexi bacterium]|nr:glycosyltransferase family 39 protein [Chloroflexota bacterium]